MSALKHLDQAVQQLESLEAELTRCKTLQARLNHAILWDELARVENVGGAVYLNAGTPRKLRHIESKIAMLSEQLTSQHSRVESCRAAAATEQVARFRNQRDQIQGQVLETIAQLTTLVEQLDHIQSAAEQADIDAAEFDPTRILDQQQDENVVKLPVAQEVENAAKHFVQSIYSTMHESNRNARRAA